MKIIWSFLGCNIPTIRVSNNYDIRYNVDLKYINPCDFVVLLNIQSSSPTCNGIILGSAYPIDKIYQYKKNNNRGYETDSYINVVIQELLSVLKGRDNSVNYINNSNFLEYYTRQLIVEYSNISAYPSCKNFYLGNEEVSLRNYIPVIPIHIKSQINIKILDENTINDTSGDEYIKNHELFVFINAAEYDLIQKSECEYYAVINNNIITLYDNEKNKSIDDRQLNIDNCSNYNNMLTYCIIDFLNNVEYNEAPVNNE